VLSCSYGSLAISNVVGAVSALFVNRQNKENGTNGNKTNQKIILVCGKFGCKANVYSLDCSAV